MKRGAKWRSLGEGLEPRPPQRVFGIPIFYNPQSKQLAEAKGIWPWKRIIVGPAWFSLNSGSRMAVLMHEAKHCLAFHLEKRLLMLPLFWTTWVLKVTHRQEMDADAFAVEQGYGVELLGVIQRFRVEDGDFYPTYAERAKHLRERIHATA
jgi:hypothetical protein